MATLFRAGLLTLLFFGEAFAQQKVSAPHQIRLPHGSPTLSAAQVETCLITAREISQLTDQASVAKESGDVEAFNSTVEPYNSALSRWNSHCVTPYEPADMIRAENRMGVRLCKFTRSPCMSEAERTAVLARERARQGGQLRTQDAPHALITRGTGIAPKRPSTIERSKPLPAPAAGRDATSMYAWWLTQSVSAIDTQYHSIPTTQLKLPLARMSLLSCSPSSGQFTANQCAEIAANGATFMVIRDLDGDGQNELIETAVGYTLDGRSVAVLIVSNPTNSHDHEIFLQNSPGFSALFTSDTGVSWFTCMECGHGFQVTKDTSSQRIKLVGDGYVDQPESSPRKGTSPPAKDIDAERAWALNQQASAMALEAEKLRFGLAQLDGAQLDEAVTYQKEVYATQVRQLVRASLPSVDTDLAVRVTLRIINAEEAGTDEAIETVCLNDIQEGRTDSGMVERCDDARREGFMHAYKRRQQLESR